MLTQAGESSAVGHSKVRILRELAYVHAQISK